MAQQGCLKLMVMVYSGLTGKRRTPGTKATILLPYSRKLTEDHFQLNPSSRMRNKLAEDVLDRKMLILMKVDCFL